MTTKIQDLRERRNALAKDTRDLLDKNPGAEWKADHQTAYDSNMAEIERIDGEIARHQKVLDMDAERAFADMGGRERRNQRGAADGEDDSPVAQARALYSKWLRGGDKAMSAEDWQQINATMSANPAVNPEQGGYTVPTEVSKSVIEALKAYGGMRNVATVIATAGGNPIQFPTTDGTSEEGEIVAENQSASDQDITFGIKTISAYKYSSKVVTVPWELLQDSAVDVEQIVRSRIEMRLGRVTNKHYTVGTGTNQPQGILTASTLGKAGATSATPVITYDDLIDLEHSVDPAYRDPARWMFHDQMLAIVRKVKDSTGRPIFVPGYEANAMINGGAPAQLLGRPIQINQHMPTPAAAAKSILFGDFSKYTIRDVMSVTLFRFTDSAYTKKGQVGFLAWMRTDGALLDIGGAVKHFAHGPAA